MGEFVWDKKTQGLILSSFFWGYILTQIPGGWISVRFGGKRVFGYFTLGCIIFTMITPVAARTHYGFLIFVRIIAGICQGVVFPATYAMWSFWAPPLERSHLVSWSVTGVNLGNIITFPVSGLLCDAAGWDSLFYFFGGVSFIWFLLWMFLVYDTPADHPRISPNERNYIQLSLFGQMKEKSEKEKILWKKLLTSLPVWAIIVNHFSNNYGFYTLLTQLPAFMKEVLKFDIKNNGFYSALPFLVSWLCSYAAGPTADYLRRRKILSTKNVRRIFNSCGLVGPAVFMLGASRVGCDNRMLAVSLFVIGQAFAGLRMAGYMCSHIDIAPKYAAIVFGMSNTAGTISGIVAPYVAGVLVGNQSPEEWEMVFNVACVVMILGATFYLIFIDGEVQSWAKEEIDSPDINEDRSQVFVETPDITKNPKLLEMRFSVK